MYGEGISKEGDILDLASELGIVKISPVHGMPITEIRLVRDVRMRKLI